MDCWNDYLIREDLESEPGVIDSEKIRLLTLNLYLKYIGGCVELGGYEFPDTAAQKMEDVMTEEYMCRVHAMEGHFPEWDEIDEYLRKPENIEIRQYWTHICMHANKENGPALEKQIRKEWAIPEDIPVKNEEKIKQQMEETAKKRTWNIKEF